MEIGEVEDEGRIVPQLKIGADGSIQLDEARYKESSLAYICSIQKLVCLELTYSVWLHFEFGYSMMAIS